MDDGRSIAGGAVAGAIAGLAAGWVMVKFQELLADARKGRASSGGSGGAGPAATRPAGPPRRDEPATAKAARALSARLGHELSDEEAQQAAPLMHYGFAASMGALYGALAEAVPRAAAGSGMLFGAALWLGADEIAVPALGFSQPTLTYPPAVHGAGLLSHLVWGATTDAIRRVLRLVR